MCFCMLFLNQGQFVTGLDLLDFNWTAFMDSVQLSVLFYFFHYFLLVHVCVGVNWLSASF